MVAARAPRQQRGPQRAAPQKLERTTLALAEPLAARERRLADRRDGGPQ
ncbi:MAG TPA: hypothetical protein VE270_09385 [Thermoleophilaceae bacterium]|nr:hypothetical protein [Thermoleophilaceae bacterium]